MQFQKIRSPTHLPRSDPKMSKCQIQTKISSRVAGSDQDLRILEGLDAKGFLALPKSAAARRMFKKYEDRRLILSRLGIEWNG